MTSTPRPQERPALSLGDAPGPRHPGTSTPRTPARPDPAPGERPRLAPWGVQTPHSGAPQPSAPKGVQAPRSGMPRPRHPGTSKGRTAGTSTAPHPEASRDRARKHPRLAPRGRPSLSLGGAPSRGTRGPPSPRTPRRAGPSHGYIHAGPRRRPALPWAEPQPPEGLHVSHPRTLQASALEHVQGSLRGLQAPHSGASTPGRPEASRPSLPDARASAPGRASRAFPRRSPRPRHPKALRASAPEDGHAPPSEASRDRSRRCPRLSLRRVQTSHSAEPRTPAPWARPRFAPRRPGPTPGGRLRLSLGDARATAPGASRPSLGKFTPRISGTFTRFPRLPLGGAPGLGTRRPPRPRPRRVRAHTSGVQAPHSRRPGLSLGGAHLTPRARRPAPWGIRAPRLRTSRPLARGRPRPSAPGHL